MDQKKKRKHSFSKEEKQLIQKLKSELKLKEVPRDQWSVYIQTELSMQQKSKGFSRSKFVNAIKGRFGKVVRKVASKRFGNYNEQMEEFKDFFKENSQDGMDFMNQMFSDIKFNNINDLGKNGTTLKKNSENKKKVVDLDFLDDD